MGNEDGQWSATRPRHEPPTAELRDSVSAVFKKWEARSRTERATMEAVSRSMARWRRWRRPLVPATALLIVVAVVVLKAVVVDQSRAVTVAIPTLRAPTVDLTTTLVLKAAPPVPAPDTFVIFYPPVHMQHHVAAAPERPECQPAGHAGDWPVVARTCRAAVAVALYQEGVAAGDTRALTYLGWAYANGEGVTPDGAAAERLFRTSAEAGNAEGEYSLGMLYAHGSGVTQSDSAAVFWLRRAMVGGNEYARAELARRGVN